jgi:hypothetical protein
MSNSYSIVELKLSPVGSSNKPVKVTVIEAKVQQPGVLILLPGAEAQYLRVSEDATVEFEESSFEDLMKDK